MRARSWLDATTALFVVSVTRHAPAPLPRRRATAVARGQSTDRMFSLGVYGAVSRHPLACERPHLPSLRPRHSESALETLHAAADAVEKDKRRPWESGVNSYPCPDSNRGTRFRKPLLYPPELQGHERDGCRSASTILADCTSGKREYRRYPDNRHSRAGGNPGVGLHR